MEVSATDTDSAESYLEYLHSRLDQLVWLSAQRIWDGPGKPPVSLCGPGLGRDQVKTGYLTLLTVLTDVGTHVHAETSIAAVGALRAGADAAEVARQLGVTRQAVEKRWGPVTQGRRVAAVISRRDRVRQDPADPRGQYGEVGGLAQYDSDRGVWSVGATVRTKAQYAIVAVDSTVQRVYEIDHWRPRMGKWEFTAVGGRELTADEIEAAYSAGDLPLRPGDHCPTRRGGAYRPYWF